VIKLFRNISLSRNVLLALAVLLFGSSFFFNKIYKNRASVNQEASRAEKFIRAKYDEFNKLSDDTALVNGLLNRSLSAADFAKSSSGDYGFFLYTVSQFDDFELKFWSDNLIVPEDSLLVKADGEYFEHLSNGWYYIIRKTLPQTSDGASLFSIAMVPVKTEFFITTDYLPKQLVYNKTAERRVQLSIQPTEFPVKSMSGEPLFYLDKKSFAAVPYNDLKTNILRFGGVLFFLIFLHLTAEAISRKKNVRYAVGFLFVSVLILRIVAYYFPSILNLRQFDFFDPTIYGSNAIQRSLGDLLINAGLFCWIVLFAWAKLRKSNHLLSGLKSWQRWAAGFISLCMLILSTFVLATTIRSLVADSKISFDVSNFFELDEYTWAGFSLLACLSLTYYYFSQLLFRFIFPLFSGRQILIYFFIGVAGLAYLSYLTLQSSGPDVLFYLPVLIWLLIYTWLANRKGLLFHNFRINITGTITWLFIFSVSVTFVMYAEIKKVEWEKRKRIANQVAFSTDPASEMLMSLTMKYLDNEFLQENFYRFYNVEESRKIRDSIIADNYSGYQDKYDTRLYVYDSSGNPLNNEDGTTYESLQTILNVQSKQTQTEGLYYYEAALDKYNYITRRDATDSSGTATVGSLFIVSSPKNFSNEALLPELFRRFKGDDPEDSPIYSYAVYTEGRLVSPPGNYPFPTWLSESEIPTEEFQQKINGSYDELWYRASNKKVVVITRKKETILETITLFSYIFCFFLLLLGLVQLFSLILRFFYSKSSFRKFIPFNIRTQVHATIIFISIFSFLVIGVATIYFFISRYNKTNSDKLSRTMKIMVNEMEQKLDDHNTFDDVVRIDDSISHAGLQNLVNEVSDIHGVDINVYDLNGNLKVTSEANVYTKGVLSKKINPIAYYHLSHLRQVQHAQEERVGNLSYLSMYSPVRDDRGYVYAYINIPYFTSRPELEQQISNFLVTIIILNAFIFLIAGLIALIIANRITRSFSFISDKMKDVNLSKMNQPIVWNRDDEIGELVKEYNKMVGKLEVSASALAKSEREGAWREMARQVAHEIKNPLTPMKLSIQYLQKAIDYDQPNVKELSSNVANTLVEQIDHLSKIAADFSQFANISNTEVKKFDLHEVLGSLKGLYNAHETVRFVWLPVDQEVIIEADKTQINRLFTNLFANALEACNDADICLINVAEEIIEDKIRISIRDNGEGIPEEMQDKIFIPNFTTKTSGTGLGLAMCKGIVEQAKGEIWFETQKGAGTTFFVELPLVK